MRCGSPLRFQEVLFYIVYNKIGKNDEANN